MRIVAHLIVTIALSSLTDYAKGFPSRWGSRRTHGTCIYRRNPSVPGYPLLASLNGENTHIESGIDSTNWTMEEDWALVDNLPLYTVSTDTETKTFWTQLWSANSALFSTKQPEELQRRALELQKERKTGVSGAQTNQTDERDGRSLVFGDSPPVLDNWKLDLEQTNNRVVGQMAENDRGGRRTIWFHYHSIGRFEGDPFADRSSSTVSLLPGGYIEAVGGKIYELGQPMLVDEGDKNKPSTTGIGSNSNNNNNNIQEGRDAASRWWLPGSTAAISALVSSTILSACIGYGAGMSIIQDHSSNYRPTQPPMTVQTVRAGPSQNYGEKLLPPSSKTSSDASLKPSTEELRARAEYRVLREERLLKKISQRLEVDKQNLKQLEDQQSSELRP